MRMRDLLLRERYSCTPVCRMGVFLEPVASAIGPAGDRLYLPFRVTGGSIVGVGNDKNILTGDDFTIMYADEKLIHEGRLVVGDSGGDLLVWYSGTTLTSEGAYDELLDGALPAGASCRLSVKFVSSSLPWRFLTRRPLLGVGTFDARAGLMEVIVLSVSENEARN